MATTTLNILQRLGGPIMTMAVTILIVWKTRGGAPFFAFPFSAGFVFLTGVQVLLFCSALRLPMRIEHDGEARQDVRQEALEAIVD